MQTSSSSNMVPQHEDLATQGETLKQSNIPDLRVCHSDSDEETRLSWIQWFAPYLAEAIGTFLITLAYLCSILNGDPVFKVTSYGVTVMVVTYMIGHISGGHVNPCVSLALWLCRRMRLSAALLLIIFQIFGACVAALLMKAVNSPWVEFKPASGFGWSQAVIVQIIYLSMVCFVFLSCAASRRNNPATDKNCFIGLAVGFSYIAAGYASATISHTVLNPAISIALGLALESGFTWGLWCLAPEALAVGLAVVAYRCIQPDEATTTPLDSSDEEEEQGGTRKTNWDNPSYAYPDKSKVMAEFVGTFYIVFTKALCMLGGSSAESWSMAACVGAMTYSLQGVSGAYFNPAVNVAALLTRRGVCSSRQVFLYTGIQILAAVTAEAFFVIVSGGAAPVVKPPGQYPSSAVAKGEVLFTAMYCYVLLATTTVSPVPGSGSITAQNNIMGLAVGFCLAAGGVTMVPISGAFFNPIMVFTFTGWKVAYHGAGFAHTWIYILYEMIGAALGAGSFFITHVHLYKKAMVVYAGSQIPPVVPH